MEREFYQQDEPQEDQREKPYNFNSSPYRGLGHRSSLGGRTEDGLPVFPEDVRSAAERISDTLHNRAREARQEGSLEVGEEV